MEMPKTKTMTMVFVLAASLVACSSTTATVGCGSDADCKGSRVCKAGACVDDGAPAPTGSAAPAEFCEAYAAQCGADADLAGCKQRCEIDREMRVDDCYFAACGVETGKCDNDEPGDVAIIACAERHGWRKP
jgi:hypothetical protein